MILIDGMNLCYRAHYTHQKLSYKNQNTGVIYGFLVLLMGIYERFHDSNFVFCWDSKQSYRQRILKTYKENRRNSTPEQQAERKLIRIQARKLRTQILPEIGFKRQYRQFGYEADDLIAQAVRETEERVIIISGDHDLFQLLSSQVRIFNGSYVWTRKRFISEFNIDPERWALVKSIAGCSSDNVPGIKGIAEKSAIKFLNDDLHGKKKELIEDFIQKHKKRYNDNFTLVRLPFTGPCRIKLEGLCLKDNFHCENSFPRFCEVCKRYGMKTLTKGAIAKQWEIFFKDADDLPY